MKGFFRQYSYSIIKMFVNQFAIAIFGAVLTLATAATHNSTLIVGVSLFSVAFYLFLIYTMTWEIGAKDRISVDYGRKPYRPHTGLWLSLLANIPNLLIATLFAISQPFATTQEWAGNLHAVLLAITIFVEGMYYGIISRLGHVWWMYFLVVIPALLSAWFSYYMGFKNKRFLAGYFDKRTKEKNQR